MQNKFNINKSLSEIIRFCYLVTFFAADRENSFNFHPILRKFLLPQAATFCITAFLPKPLLLRPLAQFLMHKNHVFMYIASAREGAADVYTRSSRFTRLFLLWLES
ncbi:hypothetical protein B5J92_05700 [Moraxella atlantae]|nr:hypothetical protein B5J92_05700 [Moraxella atlantae]